MSFDAPAAFRQNIAVIGAGISGMAAARLLAPQHQVTLFEAAPQLGGHARTVLAGLRGDQPVDTGFIVFNYANYPHLTRMFADLDVPVAKSDMSFAASIGGGQVEYALRDLGARVTFVTGPASVPAPDGVDVVRVETALLSRRQLDGYLKSQSHRWQEGKQPELWVLAADNPPIVLAGFGEAARARRIAARRRTGYGLLLLALLVLAAVAITPTLQLRARAIEAVNAYTDLHNRTAPLARQREALVKTTDRLTVVSELVSGGVDPLTVLDLLTQALPDDTSLLNLQLQGLKVTMAGQTTNAAALMQHLSAQPGVRDVRAPSAATKPLGVTKESFSIEFMLDPKTLPSLTGADTKAVEPVVGTAAPASAPAASAAAVPASAASATPPAAVASSPRPATGANAAPAAAASGATAERPHASTSNGKPAP